MKTKEVKNSVRQCLECGLHFSVARETNICPVCEMDDTHQNPQSVKDEHLFFERDERKRLEDVLQEKIEIKKEKRKIRETPEYQDELKRLKESLDIARVIWDNQDAFHKQTIKSQNDAIESLNNIILSRAKESKKLRKKNKKLKKENKNLRSMIKKVVEIC